MDTSTKLNRLKRVVEDNFMDVDDLCLQLELTVEDLLDRFEDKLLDNANKFIPDGYFEDEEEELVQEGEVEDAAYTGD